MTEGQLTACSLEKSFTFNILTIEITCLVHFSDLFLQIYI